MNTFGHIYRLTSFGESHGPAIGGVIDGCPAGILLDFDEIRRQLRRRRPGQSAITTSRCESDEVEFLSGIFEGRTTGAPIGFITRNADHHSADYDNLRDVYRPSHADFTYQTKYGVRDHRGGGRSSARVTLPQVVYGAIAAQIIGSMGITVTAYTSAVGDIILNKPYSALNLTEVDCNDVRCPDKEAAEAMRRLILDVKAEGDTVGGVVSCVIKGCPAGLGEPVFGKLHARLASAMMGINAAKAFEYGMGFDGCSRRGSEMIDNFTCDNGRVHTLTNHSGGIQGGISNGEDIYFKVGFKPVATLLRDVATVDSDGNKATIKARGRHDPCVVPRAVPVVESMAAAVILDLMLCQSATKSVTVESV